MNSNLYNKEEEIPEQVKKYLKQCFDSAGGANENTAGYRRNIELRNSNIVTYQQLKRIKNFFDNFNVHKHDLPYILNGGDYFRNWVNQTLNRWRDNDYMSKKIKSEVLPNQFIRPHEKNNLTNTGSISDSHSSALGFFNLDVTENLKRINDLIKKII